MLAFAIHEQAGEGSHQQVDTQEEQAETKKSGAEEPTKKPRLSPQSEHGSGTDTSGDRSLEVVDGRSTHDVQGFVEL